MRVLIVNTSERKGGAAMAANRLMDALNNNGVKARMLVCEKETDNISVAAAGGRLQRQWCFLWERLTIFVRLRLSRQRLFEIDIANAGIDITKTREFREADVIHLHWINQGFVSLGGIRKIIMSGKPIVWTMHDFWPATALCHYPRNCQAFMNRCSTCPYLPSGAANTAAVDRLWRRKVSIWSESNITFVGCSRWLTDKARRSGLLKGKVVTTIPNAIDTKVYKPSDKAEARRRLSLPQDRRLILFVSCRATDKRKGMDYFCDGCDKLLASHPHMSTDTGIVVLGGHAEEYVGRVPFDIYPLGYVNDQQRIVDVYNAADVYVTPSLEDNLPNTIMEAMACGVPCVGFKTGGIPEMIDHKKTGYVAEYMNADDLAAGMAWVLNEAPAADLAAAAVHKVAARYSQQNVAMRYIEVYNQACAMKHYRL